MNESPFEEHTYCGLFVCVVVTGRSWEILVWQCFLHLPNIILCLHYFNSFLKIFWLGRVRAQWYMNRRVYSTPYGFVIVCAEESNLFQDVGPRVPNSNQRHNEHNGCFSCITSFNLDKNTTTLILFISTLQMKNRYREVNYLSNN